MGIAARALVLAAFSEGKLLPQPPQGIFNNGIFSDGGTWFHDVGKFVDYPSSCGEYSNATETCQYGNVTDASQSASATDKEVLNVAVHKGAFDGATIEHLLSQIGSFPNSSHSLESRAGKCDWKKGGHRTPTYTCDLPTMDDAFMKQVADRLIHVALPQCSNESLMNLVDHQVDHLLARVLPAGSVTDPHVDIFGSGWTVLLHLSSGVTSFHNGDVRRDVAHSAGDVVVWWNTGTGPLHSGSPYPSASKAIIVFGFPAPDDDKCDLTVVRHDIDTGSR